jgi:hypothetical protein
VAAVAEASLVEVVVEVEGAAGDWTTSIAPSTLLSSHLPTYYSFTNRRRYLIKDIATFLTVINGLVHYSLVFFMNSEYFKFQWYWVLSN